MKMRSGSKVWVKVAMVVIVVIVAIALIALGNAAVYGGNPFFNLSQTGYGPGQLLEGTLNFSLSNEPGNTLVRASIMPGNIMKNMTVLAFLRKANAQFNCTPADCNATYSASSPAMTKTMSLTPGSEAYYGLVASGENVQLMNLSFSVEGSPGNTEAVCYETPLKIDLLNDNVIDFEYKLTSDEFCGVPRYSECYNFATTVLDAFFNQNVPFCQKIWINKTGKVKASAVVKYWGYGYGGGGDIQGNDIVFSLHDLNGIEKGSCSVTSFDSSDYDLASCDIGIDPETGLPTNFYIEKPDYYYICVKVVSAAAPSFSIKAEAEPETCGFAGAPPQAFNTDFAIAGQEAKFAPFTEEAFFNETTAIGGVSLINSLQNYIQAKYNSNCSQGCIIPMRFVSSTQQAGQQLTLKNLFFKFRRGNIDTTNNLFYNLSVVQPLLNMSMQVLPFSAMNLSAPEQQGQYCNVNVWLGPLSASRQFRVEPVPQVMNVYPLAVVPNQATMFRVVAVAPSGRNIVSYVWNWGDGSSEITTTEPNASHTYGQVGNYTLIVKAVDNASMTGSKSFTITSNITAELLNSTINSLLAQISAVSAQYNALEPWYRDMLGLNLSELNATLLTYKSQLATATPQQLATMKSNLDTMNVPLNITDSLRLMESSYYPNLENIEPQYIETIAGSSYDDSQKTVYQNAIAAWQQENLDLRISGQVKTLVYATTSEDKVTVVNIRLDPLGSGFGNVYLIFSLPSGVSYSSVKIKQGNFDVHDLSDAIGFEFSDLSSSETVSIALPGKHDFSQLMFYASPKLEDLGIEGGIVPGKEKGAPWGLAIFFIVIIVLVVIGVMWFIWHGYSEKLERKLFKNKGDLYNLMNFIANAEAKGAGKEEIAEQLAKAGWTKEQINYAWNKLKKQEREEKKKALKLQKQQTKTTGEGFGGAYPMYKY